MKTRTDRILPEDRIVRAYQFYKSKRKVSKNLGIPISRVAEVLHKRRVMRPWSGFQEVKLWRGGNRGPVTRWIQAHPGVVLPSKPREIAKLVGCTVSDVHSWKTARTAKFKRLLHQLVPPEAIKTVRSRIQTIELVSGKTLTLEDLERMSRLTSDPA